MSQGTIPNVETCAGKKINKLNVIRLVYIIFETLKFYIVFCSFVKQQERYKPKNLPYGKYLHGNGNSANLQKVFEYFIKNVDRLLNMGQ